MAASGNQTQTGKAFEFACVCAIEERYKERLTVSVAESAQMETARRSYAYLEESEKKKYMVAARAATKVLDRLEPMLSYDKNSLQLSLQTDSKGMAGDVRDVLCSRVSGWSIGLSCKHNHDAVKHSRLSDKIDFGKKWFGKKCSAEYFSAVREVFNPLKNLKKEAKAAGHSALWSDIEDKEKQCYVPVLTAFMAELKRLDQAYPGEIPELLIRYLIGTDDFYKIIMNEQGKYTQIEAVNINGTLNKPNGKIKALVDAPLMKLPTKFYEIEFESGKQNTIVVVCDKGWSVSMRIHNASSKIESSLKFDVRLQAKPTSLLVQYEPWDTI